MRPGLLTVLLLLAIGLASPGQAQSNVHPYLDVSLGGSALLGYVPDNGHEYERSHLFFLVAIGNRPDKSGPLLGALHAGLLTVAGGDDSCKPAPLGCVKDYPLGAIIALTIGGRPVSGPWRFVELTAGPAAVLGASTGNGPGILAVGRLGTPPGMYLSPAIVVHVLATALDRTVMFAGGLGVSLRTW